MIYFSYTVMIVAIGAAIIGFVAGVMSVFFVSRQQSIIGDAIAHAALAGITLGFLITQERVRSILLLGAIVSGLMAVGLINIVSNQTRVKTDAAIGIVLSLFFGLGITLLSYIQTLPVASQAGLKHYLFGNIAYLRFSDLPLIILLSAVILLAVALFWKELKLISFDRAYAKTIGLPVKGVEVLIMVLGVVIIVIGVDLIGVVMMAGLLLAPAIAARQWVHTFGKVVFLSGFIGAGAGIIGTFLSANFSNLPPGPTIITVLGTFVVLSIMFSSKGLVKYYITYLSYMVRYDVEDSIRHLADHMRLNPANCDIREFDINPEHDEFPANMHRAHMGENHKLHDDLEVLIHLGYVRPREGGTWILTHKGMEAVNTINLEVPT